MHVKTVLRCVVIILATVDIVQASLWTVDELYSIHIAYLDSFASAIESQSLTAEADRYYYTSYYIHGILSAAEATKDTFALNKAMHYIDNMIGVSGDNNGDGFPDWKPLTSSNEPYQLYMFQGTGPIARAAAVILNTPEFAAYKDKADEYYTFAYNAIIGWTRKLYGDVIPWLPKDLNGWGSYKVWSDKCSHLGTIAASLYHAKDNAVCLDMATRIAQGFKRKLVENGIGWLWDEGYALADYKDDRIKIASRDVSHANREPMMMVLMRDAGIDVFSEADVERMAATLADTIWCGTLEAPLWSNYINGSNAAYGRGDGCTDGCTGNVYSGWVFMGKYSDDAQEKLEHTLKVIMDGKRVGQNRTSYGKVALSGHLLRNMAEDVTAKKPVRGQAAGLIPARIRRVGNYAFTLDNVGKARVRVFTLHGQSIPFTMHGSAQTKTSRLARGSALNVVVVEVVGDDARIAAERFLLR